jgi:hypothetical protein
MGSLVLLVCFWFVVVEVGLYWGQYILGSLSCVQWVLFEAFGLSVPVG